MVRRDPKREHLSYEENVCHTYACAIQVCLKVNNYNEKKCKKAIESWKACLKEVREGSNPNSH